MSSLGHERCWTSFPKHHPEQEIQRDRRRLSLSAPSPNRELQVWRRSRGYRGDMKTDQDVLERTKLDIEYIENWSLPLDFWIIANTMYQIFRPSKAA